MSESFHPGQPCPGLKRTSSPKGFVFSGKRRFAFTGYPYSMKGKPVAQKVQVLLVDDLEGGEADETVTFALDGVTYEIDLNTSNADKLRGLLTPFVDSGRRTGGRAGRGRGAAKAARGGTPASSQDTAKIRAWAKEKGYEVNDRGRVPATIREAYEREHG
jgi:hypothetical protein